ncbi:MAG: DUF2254 family protein [Rubrivivax sp.]
MEYAVRQLVEVAVRALSPGINDPFTAMSVLDRPGGALCDMVPLYLPNGLFLRDRQCVLVLPAVDYEGLVDGMFHLIRQNGSSSAAVLVRMLEVFSAVATFERNQARLQPLQRHADLVVRDARRRIATPADLNDILQRAEHFQSMRLSGPLTVHSEEQRATAA